jgi:hypothetical protein
MATHLPGSVLGTCIIQTNDDSVNNLVVIAPVQPARQVSNSMRQIRSQKGPNDLGEINLQPSTKISPLKTNITYMSNVTLVTKWIE